MSWEKKKSSQVLRLLLLSLGYFPQWRDLIMIIKRKEKIMIDFILTIQRQEKRSEKCPDFELRNFIYFKLFYKNGVWSSSLVEVGLRPICPLNSLGFKIRHPYIFFKIWRLLVNRCVIGYDVFLCLK